MLSDYGIFSLIAVFFFAVAKIADIAISFLNGTDYYGWWKRWLLKIFGRVWPAVDFGLNACVVLALVFFEYEYTTLVVAGMASLYFYLAYYQSNKIKKMNTWRKDKDEPLESGYEYR